MIYCDTKEYKDLYCYGVKYIENGIVCADVWSAKTLAQELLANEVLIVSVEHRSLWDTEDD